MNTDNAPTPGTSSADRLAIGPYQLRGLLYRRIDPDQDAWRATLLEGRRRIARLESSQRHGPVVAYFNTRTDEIRMLTFAARRAQLASDDPGFATVQREALQELMLELADRAYQVRQLQVQSRRHTLFRLRGDPEESFRTLKNAPYSAAREGQLRLIYGQRLVEIIRGGARGDPAFSACAA
jgi:hypothetical protein